MASELPEEYVSLGFSAVFSYDGGTTNILSGYRLIDVTIGGEETDQLDCTDQSVISNFKEFISALTDGGSTTFKLKWDGKKPPAAVMVGTSNLPKRGELSILFQGVEIWSCDANIKKTGGLNGTIGQLLTRDIEFKVSGEPVHTEYTVA